MRDAQFCACRRRRVLHSLRSLKKLGDLKGVDPTDLEETLPGLVSMARQDGLSELARVCRGCVRGAPDSRFTAFDVVHRLAKAKGRAEFFWRNGTTIVYHTLEPGDNLHLSEDGAFARLSRHPRRRGESISLVGHIKHGSRFKFRSQFISCSLSLPFCIFYAQKQNNMFHGYGLAPVLEIDLSKLRCDKFEEHVFDGTRQDRAYAEMKREERFAADAEEVIVDVVIPSSAVKAVYNLNFRQRDGESSKKHLDRAGLLEKLHRDLNGYAVNKLSPFGRWEKHFNQLIRQRGDGDDVLEKLKNQARVPDGWREVEEVLRASYCGRNLSEAACQQGGTKRVQQGWMQPPPKNPKSGNVKR